MDKILKCLMLLLVTTLSFTFTACSDDDDEPSNKYSVVGVWRHDFSYGEGYMLLTFDKSGKYTLVEFEYGNGSWSENGTYTVKDNIMKRVLSDGEVEVYTILTLTKNTMVTRYEGSYLGQYPNQYDDEYIEEWTRVE